MYHSAAEQAAVGGDLYEVLDSPWGVRLLVGDVRGKGLDAVRLANRVLGCFRARGAAGVLPAPATRATLSVDPPAAPAPRSGGTRSRVRRGRPAR
jgi:sigma-B regulation protein RsbU (phosphoserine phosphatase)